MSYSKRCDGCNNIIFMFCINGKWFPYDDQTVSMSHKCIHSSKTDTLQDKVQSLEKIVRRLYDLLQIQSEQLRDLEKRFERLCT
jgi:hypothetical protein